VAIIPLAVAVPLIAAGLLVVFGRVAGRGSSEALALLATLATTAFCASLLARSGGLEVYWFSGWEPRDGIAIGIDFAVDALGAGLATLASVLMVAALVLMLRYRDTDAPHFQVLMLVFLAGMVGMCLTGDLFNLFVFFELMSVSAFALTGYRVESGSIEGALNFAVTNTIGALLILIGLALTYARTGALNLAQIGHALAAGSGSDGLVVVALALLVCGFLVKAAIVPFHLWLADAYAVAPTPVCLLFAGAMSELGIYAVARIWFSGFGEALAPHADALRLVLICAGCATALVGAVMAMGQDHLKRMLAFSTISYAGVFLIGLGLLTADGVAATGLYIVADGFGKAALFAAVGIVQHRRRHTSEARLHGAGRALPWTALIVVLGALSFAAIPPFGTFFAKALLEDGLVAEGYGWVIAVLVCASALTAGAVLRMAARVFLGWGEPGTESLADDEEPGEEEEESAARTPAVMWIPAFALVVAALAVGLVPGTVEAAQQAAERFTDGAGYGRAVLDGTAPPPIPAPPEFTAKVSAYLYSALTLAGALGIAAVAIYAPRLRSRPLRWVTRAAPRALAPIRRVHSGHIGDYVALLVLGVAAFGGAFALALG
jgi:multicomponent Na+:H+ antiporter subunit D